MLHVGTFRPVMKACKVACPLLVQVGDRDETTPPEPAIKMAGNAPKGELKRYPYGHFDPYVGEAFERFVTDQVEFLQRVLVPQAAAVAAYGLTPALGVRQLRQLMAHLLAQLRVVPCLPGDQHA